MSAAIRELELFGASSLTTDDLRAQGLIPPRPPGQRSLVQRIRAQKTAEKEAHKNLSKRERRRQYDENLRKLREGKS